MNWDVLFFWEADVLFIIQEQKQSKASSQVTAIHTKFAESKSGQAPSISSSSLVCPNGSLPATSAGSPSMRAPLAQPEAHTKESLLMLLTQNQGSARNTAVVSSAPASWPADSPVWLDSSHSTQTEKLRPAQPAQATARYPRTRPFRHEETGYLLQTDLIRGGGSKYGLGQVPISLDLASSPKIRATQSDVFNDTWHQSRNRNFVTSTKVPPRIWTAIRRLGLLMCLCLFCVPSSNSFTSGPWLSRLRIVSIGRGLYSSYLCRQTV